MWPFASSVCFHSIHFFIVCCICSGDRFQITFWSARNRNMNLDIGFSFHYLQSFHSR